MIRIAPDDNGQRVDRYLKKLFPNLAFGQVQKLLRTGQIRMNGKRLKPDSRLEAGAELRLPPNIDTPPLEKKAGVSPKDAAFIQSLVIYSDGQMVAIDKPSGLAVQGGTNINRHVDGMLDALTGESGICPRIVHRLDRETSGVLLLARSAESARKLGIMFAERQMHKTYYAITCPAPQDDDGYIDAPIAKGLAGVNVEKMMIEPVTGKVSVTEYHVIARGDNAALVAFMPLSGRMHQIRVHAAHIGCPLLGDEKYGGLKANRLFLHAKTLTFMHPKSGKDIEINAELPQDFDIACKKLNIECV